jgi:surface carbohydrate biosynthesis protein
MKGFKVTWKKPRKSSVLIYDNAGEVTLRRLLNEEFELSVLDTRGTLYVFPELLIRLVALLWRKRHFSDLWENASLRVCYEHALMESLRPHVVLNFGEHNLRFGLLSRLYCEACFLGIQNGYRQSEVRKVARLNYLTNAFCFGQETVDNYTNSGSNIQNFTVIGSLNDALYREQRSHVPIEEYDLAFISQFRTNRFTNETVEIAETTIHALEFLARFCSAKRVNCVIVGNTKPAEQQAEKDFFSPWIEQSCFTFIENDRSEFSSYRKIDQSRLAICVNSTAGIEALGRGNKVLFINFSKNNYYDIQGQYFSGVWSLSTCAPAYKEFSDRLDRLLEMSAASWSEASRDFVEYFIQCDDDPSPQEVLRKRINSYLGQA